MEQRFSRLRLCLNIRTCIEQCLLDRAIVADRKLQRGDGRIQHRLAVVVLGVDVMTLLDQVSYYMFTAKLCRHMKRSVSGFVGRQ